MVSTKAVAALLAVHAAALLASRTEAYVPIFTYSELQRMEEQERDRGHKKSLQQRSEEAASLGPAEPLEGEESRPLKLTAPVEIGMRTNSRQLEKYRAALEGLLRETTTPGWVVLAAVNHHSLAPVLSPTGPCPDGAAEEEVLLGEGGGLSRPGAPTHTE
ncbi:promotilin [Echinops telfairi]|uniref:Promotilin n=1 Tax=Echinops telfairi TaxID=9371 RepID=A0AC55D909_ECHTE|nr:promotilin [Echinops telfairi]